MRNPAPALTGGGFYFTPWQVAMTTKFQCADCGVWVIIPSRSIRTVSCRRCGTTYLCNDGGVSKFYPSLSMFPVDTPITPCSCVSMWMLPWTRPIRHGLYDCRFRTIEPNIIRLRWNGAGFVVPDTGERVAMSHFLTWRGVLA